MTASDRDTVMRVHLISGIPYDVVKDVLEGLSILTFINHLEDKSTKIPYIGSIEAVHKGDEITRRGKRAIVEPEFKLDEFFIRNVGKAFDKEETDFELMTKKKIKESLCRIGE